MKNLTLTLVLLPILSLAATAQDVSWSDLTLGDRIEVTFRSGATLGGTLVAPNPKVTAVDYAKESALILDVTWEYPGLNGTMTVPKGDLKSVRKMRVLDEKTRTMMEEAKKRLAEENATPTAAPRPAAATPAPAPAKPPVAAPVDPKEELQKAVDFYAKFPPPYWGPERHTMNLQKQARGQAWNAAEAEFEKDYLKLWEKGRASSAPKKD